MPVLQEATRGVASHFIGQIARLVGLEHPLLALRERVEVLKADSSLDLGASGEEKDASDPCPGNEQNHNRDKHRHAFESRSAALLVGEIVGVGVAVRNGRTARANCLAAAPCPDSGDRWRMPDLA